MSLLPDGYTPVVRLPRLLLCCLTLITLVLLPACAQAATDVPKSGDGRVLVAPLTGTVDPVMLEFTTRVIERAEKDGFDAIVFELETPGGLSTSMDDIVQAIIGTPLPVYVYVSPSGGRAASAGVFITYAADVAAMAPSTNIGSATPINSNGSELPKDLRRKVVNDAVAKITEIAKERDRNEQFAEDAIRKASNVGARKALEIGIIEFIAEDVRGLLQQSAGLTVEPKSLTLNLADAKVEEMSVPWTLQILKKIVDPNLLFLLFGAGVIGLAFELTHPGVVLPGVAGGIALLISLFGLSVLPATGAGIALLVLAAALFAAEAIAPGGGVLGVGGAIALLVGALLLFDDASGYVVSPVLAVGVSLTIGSFFVLLLRKAWHVRLLPATTGSSSLVGMEGIVRRSVGGADAGSVYVDGELWDARADDGVAAGERVRVTGVDGMQIEVAPIPDAPNEGEQA